MTAVDKVAALDPAVAAVLDELLAAWRRALELDLRVAAPAHVVAYDAVTQTATLQLGALPVRLVEGEEVVQPPVLIPGVPVLHIGGVLAYVAPALAPGDTGLAVFTDRSLAQWLRLGIPTDPLNGRTHALGDAVFIPGLRPSTTPLAPPPPAGALTAEAPLVRLGAAAAEFGLRGTALASTWNTTINALPIAAVDPATTMALANAIRLALIALNTALQGAVSTKVQIE